VPCKEYDNLKWIVENWTVHAAVSAERSAKTRVAEAIIRLSEDAETEHIFQCSGWIVADEKRHFLNGGWCVGAAKVRVEMDLDLVGYALPQPTTDYRKSLLASLRLLKVGSSK